MPRKINLSKIFSLLRNAPPEVSFSQVEFWVENYSVNPVKKKSWLAKWLSKWHQDN